MKFFHLTRSIARLIALQRIELISEILKKIRKLFGRFVFTNFILIFFLNQKTIGKNYYKLMIKEYFNIKKITKFDNKKILTIGGGIGGLEALIGKFSKNINLALIEKNYISNKVKYGWDNKNNEAYNSINLVKKFLKINKVKLDKFKLYDYDKDTLPLEKFDLIISLYSLDYHYDFNIYKKYFKKVSHKKTEFIFDTIRPDYFKKIYKNIKIIKSDLNTIHKSKRIICRDFI